MNGWMTHHGDGYRRVHDNNEYKIRNANKMDGWMETGAGMLLVIMNIK